MFSDKFKSIGEHPSIAEELLFKVPELEQKCRTVEKAVKEGYFTFQEALTNYKISEIDYLTYLLLEHNQKLKMVRKQEQVFDTINAVVSIFISSSSSFDAVGKKAFSEIKKISEKATSKNKVLIK